MSDAFAHMAVWVVDDDPMFRRVTGTQLQQLGVGQTRQLAGALEVLELLGENAPVDILICDLRMPDMDGIELLRHIADRRPGLGIIIVSELNDRLRYSVTRLAQAHPLYLLGSVGKPVARDDLLALLRQYNPQQRSSGQTGQQFRIGPQELRDGLSRGEFCVHIQPIVSVTDGQVQYGEMLARWSHPTHGLLAPGHFLPLIESEGLIDDLLHSTLNQALATWQAWETRDGGNPPGLGVNVSVRNLSQLQLPDAILEVLSRHGRTPGDLKIEITESEFMHDLRVSLDVLNRLSMNDIELVIDDFGTGFSSLQQLNHVPFSQLKLDRSFVNSAADFPDSRAILESSIQLAHRLNLRTVAEGVETLAQQEMVTDMGCDSLQGYFIARPMPLEDFPVWCAAREAG